MSNQKCKLAKEAYGGCKGENYEPFIPITEAMPETTGYSIILGIVMACLFAAANTYLGLKVGLTIAAGIPGAILATGILKGLFRRNNILEANMVASLAAMGESIAGGIIFTLPALILWKFELSITTIIIVTIIGGLMGTFFITPLRRFLIVEEHGELVYPESMAAAEVLVTGSQGGEGFKTVVSGLGVGGAYKFLSGGFKLWNEQASYVFKSYQGTMISVDTLASLLGVGFIVGTKASLLMFGGSVIAWFGLIPLIKYLGAGLAAPLFPSAKLIADMTAPEIWSSYIKYIGAGAVAMGGFISLAKSMPTIIKSFKQAMGGIGHGGKEDTSRINIEAPITWVLGAAVFGFALTWLFPMIKGGFIGGLLAVLFSFFFAVVSARMVGIIGASNNPVSGMTIATLLFVTTILKLTGVVGNEGLRKSILIGGVVCVAIAVAGGAAQSLKTTFIIGGTPKKVQIGMFIAIACSSGFAAIVVKMLHSAYGIGSADVSAPQASLMKMLVEGIMSAKLPWTLVLVGAAIAIFCELASIPILPVALGIYLPISLNSAILTGGILRVLVERKFKKDEERKSESVEKGVLLASGLVAGDALIGIVIAVFATLNINIAFGEKIMPTIANSNTVSFVIFILLGAWIYKFACSKKEVVCNKNKGANV
ncbi:oligopeptide transporter, OPT family [Clostridium botulinum]|uniref:Oligopeptide transporter, OPT family n=2 Tax=Clostridium botulinum TaxID=1491 RepID=A0A846HYF1_CLOBO|nr:oligopeptide transporter, OPT family [Clostridium botulinum]ACQ54966.1 oligopeptide transporter, OPT family [Clostridium botulinum Ba4 str. 657]AJE10001.1 oligopeptide transporter, OPT family [Clostridium botulinum CDC_1436]APR00875.1 oligopeptide transporter, OPT family [Clostridium botulinum]APU61118.1 oligopeptide transporter, OPT family [Clostridium botulinum]AUN03722.1 oligopeptide transporter, OPT family [Clostridium botulinum]